MNRQNSVVKQGRQQRGRRVSTAGTLVEGRRNVIKSSGSAGGDHWNRNRLGNGTSEVQVVPRLGAVTIHGCEQDFSSAEPGHLTRPINGIKTGVLAATLHEDIPSAAIAAPGIDRHNDALTTESLCALFHKLWPANRRGVEADLVSSGPQELRDPFHRADPSPNSEWNRDLLGRTPHQIDKGGTPFMTGRDVQKHQLVGSGLAVPARKFDGISCIAQSHKVDALDHPTSGHIKTGDQAKSDHDVRFAAVNVAATSQASQAMSQQAVTIDIGSKVRVTRVRDRIPNALVELLKSDANGTVIDFRTVDGKGIGVVVQLSDGSTNWFFEDEIAPA